MTKPVLEFSDEAREHYFSHLQRSLAALVKDLTRRKVVSKAVSDYIETFGNIIGIYAANYHTGKFQQLRVSNNSGFPMYSRIAEVVFDQRRALAQSGELRDLKEIASDYADAFYKQNEALMDTYCGELQSAHYFMRLKELGTFEEQTTEAGAETGPGMAKTLYEHMSFPLSQMACVTLMAEVAHLTGIMSKGVYAADIARCAVHPIEVVYKTLVQSGFYPAQLKRTQATFMFHGKHTDDAEIGLLLTEKPEATILGLHIRELQNLDVVIAENEDQLQEAELDDYSITGQDIYVCSKEIETELDALMMERGEPYKIITI